MTTNPLGNFLKLPKLPVSGLWLRVLALVIDWIMILAALHTLQRSLPSFYWFLGQWSPYVNSLLTFLYFALFNSSFGKGRTLGKLIAGIRVTDYEGAPLSIRQSFIRTAIFYPFFVTVPIWQASVGSSHTLFQDYLFSMVSSIPAIAIWLATFLVVAFNPFKQGPHDFLAQSLVQRGREIQPATIITFEALAKSVGSDWRRFHRQPQLSGLVTILLVTVLLGYISYPTRKPQSIQKIYSDIYAISNEPEFKEARIDWRGPTTVAEYKAQFSMYDLPTLKEDDALSTQSLVYLLDAGSLKPWAKTLPENEYPGASNRLIDIFSANIIPQIVAELSRIEVTGSPQPGSSNEAKDAHDVVEKIRNNPVIFVCSLNEIVSLTPYPYPLKRTVYSQQQSRLIPSEPQDNPDSHLMK